MEQKATAKPVGIAEKVNGNANGGKFNKITRITSTCQMRQAKRPDLRVGKRN